MALTAAEFLQQCASLPRSGFETVVRTIRALKDKSEQSSQSLKSVLVPQLGEEGASALLAYIDGNYPILSPQDVLAFCNAQHPPEPSISSSSSSSSSSLSPSSSAAGTPSGSTPHASVPTYNVFVNDLPSDVSDDELREAFSACGPIHSVAVVPNRKAAQPKSYGFVNFLTPAARDAALGQSKVMRVRGQPVRVFPSDSKCQLFLAQLPRSITYERLAEVITQIAGPFVSLDLKQGFAFVTFVNSIETEDALKRLRGHVLDGRPLAAELAGKKDEHHHHGGGGHGGYGGHGGGGGRYDRGDVRDVRDSRGYHPADTRFGSDPYRVAAGAVGYDRERGGSGGSGGGRERDRERDRDIAPGCTLYVRNLHDRVDENILRERFAPFGRLLNVAVTRDRGGQSRGFGFVAFAEPGQAARARAALHNSDIDGQKISVFESKPKPDERDSSNQMGSSGGRAGGRDMRDSRDLSPARSSRGGVGVGGAGGYFDDRRLGAYDSAAATAAAYAALDPYGLAARASLAAALDPYAALRPVSALASLAPALGHPSYPSAASAYAASQPSPSSSSSSSSSGPHGKPVSAVSDLHHSAAAAPQQPPPPSSGSADPYFSAYSSDPYGRAPSAPRYNY